MEKIEKEFESQFTGYSDINQDQKKIINDQPN